MSTIIVLPTVSSLHTQHVLQNNVRKVNRTRKPIRYVEFYIPTTSSNLTSRQLTSDHHLLTSRGRFYYDTHNIFDDENQIRWF